MKNILIVVFLNLSFFLFSQERDLSEYRERKLSDAFYRDSDNYLYFKSYVHIGGPANAFHKDIWGFSDDTYATSFRYNGDLSKLQKGHIIIIYYKRLNYTNNSFYDGPAQGEIYHIEFISNHFIIGNSYTLLENLRLRAEPNSMSRIILTIPSYQLVTVLEESQNEVTIDNITSKWVKVEYKGNIGWCFGGYIYNERQEWVDPPPHYD
jgi:hypothetical protein